MKQRAGYRRMLDRCRSRIRTVRASYKRSSTNARVIGVTGSSAKSTTTLLLSHILSGASHTRCLAFSNGSYSAIKSLLALTPKDEFLVVEAGAEKSGDIQRIAQILRPDVAVVTLVALEHKSAFLSPEGVMLEKSELIAGVQPGGFAVLNADDELVMRMAGRTEQRVVTFGKREGADYRVEAIEARYPGRLSFRMFWGQSDMQVSSRFVGEHFWLPALAACATAIELGIAPHIVAERVASFEPLFGRCSIMTVPSGPTFMLDCVKAPWHSLPLAFNIVEQAQAVRKRIVLGHLSDYLGNNKKYRTAYDMARAIADEVIFVGNHAHRSKATVADRENGRFHEFKSAKQAADYISRTAIDGELILLKGSKDLHLERIALGLIENVQCWPTTCGKGGDCLRCGLYERTFAEHRGQQPSWRKKVFGHKRGPQQWSQDDAAGAA